MASSATGASSGTGLSSSSSGPPPTLLRLTTTTAFPDQLTPSGHVLYSQPGANTKYAVPLTGGTPAVVCTDGESGWAIGDVVFCSGRQVNRRGGPLSTWTSSGGKHPVSTYAVQGQWHATPDGTRIVFVDAFVENTLRGDLVVSNVDGSSKAVLLPGLVYRVNSFTNTPHLVQAERRLFVTYALTQDSPGHTLAMVDLDTLAVTTLLDGTAASVPSPDHMGSRAFVVRTDGHGVVVGGPSTVDVAPSAVDGFMHADGQQVTIRSAAGGITRNSTDGSMSTPLVASGATRFLARHPATGRFAYATQRDNATFLHDIRTVAGDFSHTLEDMPVVDLLWPTFNTDATRIFYRRPPDGVRALVSALVDGTGAQTISTANMASWYVLPDGSAIYTAASASQEGTWNLERATIDGTQVNTTPLAQGIAGRFLVNQEGTVVVYNVSAPEAVAGIYALRLQ